MTKFATLMQENTERKCIEKETSKVTAMKTQSEEEVTTIKENTERKCIEEETSNDSNLTAMKTKREEEVATIKDLETDEKCLKMESEYLNISNQDEMISWFTNYAAESKNQKAVSKILSAYGLKIHRHEINEKECDVLTKILSEMPSSCELKSFSFTYSRGLQILLDKLEKSASLPKAAKVCFAGYPGLNEELSRQFVAFVRLFNAERLVLMSVHASSDGLRTLEKQIHGAAEQMKSFKGLEIYHNKDMGVGGWECLADIATNCSRIPLHISTCYCDVTDDRLQVFKDRLGLGPLDGINVCGNRKLTDKGFQTLGEIVKQSKAFSAALQDCDLDKDKIRAFADACGTKPSSMKITSLNVANNPQLGPKGMKIIKEYVQRFGVKDLNVARCGLEDANFEHKLECLDVSGNTRCLNIPKVTEFVKKGLCMRNCMLTKSELRELAAELARKPKLDKLDLSDGNRRIDHAVSAFLADEFMDVTKSLTVSPHVLLNDYILKRCHKDSGGHHEDRQLRDAGITC